MPIITWHTLAAFDEIAEPDKLIIPNNICKILDKHGCRYEQHWSGHEGSLFLGELKIDGNKICQYYQEGVGGEAEIQLAPNLEKLDKTTQKQLITTLDNLYKNYLPDEFYSFF